MNRIYWQHQAPAAPIAAQDIAGGRYDAVIVGGGFAGLSAAWHIQRARPELRLLLLEKHRIGAGASGRNAGMVLHYPLLPAALLDGDRGASGLSGLHRLLEENAREIIAAGLPLAPAEFLLGVRQGIFRAALRFLKKRADDCEIEARLLNRDEAVERSGIRWQAALLTPARRIQPSSLCQQLAALLLRAGLQIAEQTQFMRYRNTKDGLLIETSAGELRTERLVLCSNAYADDVSVSQHGRVIHSYLLATAPLSRHDAARLGGEDLLSAEIGTGFAYQRVHEGRFLFGGLDIGRMPANDRSAFHDASLARLEAIFRRRFADLHSYPIEYRWGGAFLARSADAPRISVDPACPRVIWNHAYSGAGVSLSLLSGKLLTPLLFPERDRPDLAAAREFLQAQKWKIVPALRAAFSALFV